MRYGKQEKSYLLVGQHFLFLLIWGFEGFSCALSCDLDKFKTIQLINYKVMAALFAPFLRI